MLHDTLVRIAKACKTAQRNGGDIKYVQVKIAYGGYDQVKFCADNGETCCIITIYDFMKEDKIEAISGDIIDALNRKPISFDDFRVVQKKHQY